MNSQRSTKSFTQLPSGFKDGYALASHILNDYNKYKKNIYNIKN